MDPTSDTSFKIKATMTEEGPQKIAILKKKVKFFMFI
jgi:hypothetical protein